MYVAQLNTYPVKSTAALELDSAWVGPAGLELDRHFALIDDRDRALTARQQPAMVLIANRMGGSGPECHARGMQPLPLPLAGGRPGTPFTLFDESCQGVGGFEAADRWFSEVLGLPVRLIRLDPDNPPEPVPEYARPGDSMSFADEFPLLLISQGSLTDLNGRLDRPVSMRNFRPNIVVEGASAYAEDGWRRLAIGEVTFRAGPRCARCVLTTVDPDRGERNPNQEPLRTLSGYRRQGTAGTFFGLTLIAETGGRIERGAAVEVLE